jgi:type I restriction enzyme S subunit
VSEIESCPPGWELTRVEEITIPVNTLNPSDAPQKEISYLDIGSINNELGLIERPKTLLGIDAPSRARQIVLAGDTIYSTVRPYLQAIAMVPTNLMNPIASTGFCVLRPYEGINNKFLFYFVRSDQFLQEIVPLQRGVSYPAVRSKDVLSIGISLPPSNEQNRIIDKLEELFSELDAGVKELKNAQVKLSQYRQSLLKTAFEGFLTQKWRETNNNKIDKSGKQLLKHILIERRNLWEQQKLEEFKAKDKKPPKNWQDKYPEPAEPNTISLPKLPEDWVWATIDQLSVNKRYGSSSKTNDDSSGIPVLRMGNIQHGKLDYNKLKYLPVDHQEFPNLLLSDGDLLFNRTNSAELVGKTAIYRDIGMSVSYASYLISVTFTEHFLPEIAAHFINSVRGKKWIAEVMNQTAGQANVNGTKLGALAIPLPSKNEQKALIEALTNEFDAIDRQVEATALGLKQSEAQRKNILKSAFSGQLVPQDPNDESASVLLEKIKKEREELAKQVKPKKARPPKKKVNVMDTLLEVLTSEDKWFDAQEAFKKCGIIDGTSTDRIEEIYTELRKLEKEGKIKIERNGSYDQLKLIKPNVQQEVKED